MFKPFATLVMVVVVGAVVVGVGEALAGVDVGALVGAVVGALVGTVVGATDGRGVAVGPGMVGLGVLVGKRVTVGLTAWVGLGVSWLFSQFPEPGVLKIKKIAININERSGIKSSINPF
jgi:hypothetical protein